MRVIADLGAALSIALNGAFALARGGGGFGGEAVLFRALAFVANLATYARRALLRLRVQLFIDRLATGGLLRALQAHHKRPVRQARGHRLRLVPLRRR